MSSIGRALASGGNVLAGWRQADAELARQRENTLRIQNANRQRQMLDRAASEQFASYNPIDVPSTGAGVVPGSQMGIEDVSAFQLPTPPTSVGSPEATASATRPQYLPRSGVVDGKWVGQVGMQRPLTQAEIDEQTKFAKMKQNIPQPGAISRGLAGIVDGARSLIGGSATPGPGTPGVVPVKAGTVEPYKEERMLTPEDADYWLVDRKRDTPAVKAEPTKKAKQYDNKQTKYDDLITRAASENGLDPVIFKRLIGSESSFKEDAVSPRGRNFGLGIAQINAVHGLSDADRLNPEVALPFAAKLFTQYLEQAGGNYEEALMRYKGASSPKGRASMSSVVQDVLSGTPLSAQQAGLTEPAQMDAALSTSPLQMPQNQQQNITMAESYLADPEAIPFEMQRLNTIAQQQLSVMTQQRNETARFAQMLMQSGTQEGFNKAMELRNEINQMDANLINTREQIVQKQMYLQGMQGLRELATARDPRRLSGVLTQYMGVPVAIQQRSDGTYNYWVNGQKVQSGVSGQAIASNALREFSPDARAAMAQSQALENELYLKLKYDPKQITAVTDLKKAIVDGEYKNALERIKQSGLDFKIDNINGNIVIKKDNREVHVVDLRSGEVRETPQGNITLPPQAQQVFGFN